MASVLALGSSAPNEVKAQQASASLTQQDRAASGGSESGGQNGSQDTHQDNTGQDNTGQDFTSPQNLFQLRYQYKTAPGTGSVKGSIRTVTTDTLYLRSDFAFDLGSPWKVVFRTDLPFVAKNPISSDHIGRLPLWGG